VFDSGTLLGAGGEGEVRRVELFGSSFAVKRSDARGAREAGYVDILPSAWVQLPVARARSLGVDGRVFQLFPLAAGDLAHALAALKAHRPCAQATLTPPEFRAVFAELVVAVGVLHDAGLRHADVKPQNFLVTPDNRLIIADLGLTSEATDAARGSGTRGFAAPEQESLGSDALDLLADACEFLGDAVLRRPQRDHRPIDVYALAVSCLCLVAPDWRSVQREVAAARPGWWRRRWVPSAWVPAAAAPLLNSMLARRPGRRPTVPEIRAHPFFQGTDWAAVEGRCAPLPLDLAALSAEGRRVANAATPPASS
jgi:serine/threonine protein kinase